MRGIKSKFYFMKAQSLFVKKFEDKKKCEDEENCDWSLFKESFLKFTQSRCPICEHKLTKYDDIDHFRPKKAGYTFLRCCCDNYMIMCDDCNRSYKRTSFPRYDSFKAITRETISKEKALLINPREDNIYEYFELLFISHSEGTSLLEIKVKKGLSAYQEAKAKTTIEIYGIGNCHNHTKIDSCRIEILEKHFDDFIELAEAKAKNDDEEFTTILNSRRMRKSKEYGFVEFIKRKQFKINTI